MATGNYYEQLAQEQAANKAAQARDTARLAAQQQQERQAADAQMSIYRNDPTSGWYQGPGANQSGAVFGAGAAGVPGANPPATGNYYEQLAAEQAANKITQAQDTARIAEMERVRKQAADAQMKIYEADPTSGWYKGPGGPQRMAVFGPSMTPPAPLSARAPAPTQPFALGPAQQQQQPQQSALQTILAQLQPLLQSLNGSGSGLGKGSAGGGAAAQPGVVPSTWAGRAQAGPARLPMQNRQMPLPPSISRPMPVRQMNPNSMPSPYGHPERSLLAANEQQSAFSPTLMQNLFGNLPQFGPAPRFQARSGPGAAAPAAAPGGGSPGASPGAPATLVPGSPEWYAFYQQGATLNP